MKYSRGPNSLSPMTYLVLIAVLFSMLGCGGSGGSGGGGSAGAAASPEGGGPSSASATPAAPTNLSSTVSNGQVLLTWSASSGSTGYNVLRSTASGGPYTTIAGVSSTAYIDSAVTSGTIYYYVAQATNGGMTSADSNQASAAMPGELQARVTANNTGFYVYKDQDSGPNHGFPSGFFASPGNLGTIHLDAGCVDNPADTTTGCYPSTDTTALDTYRGTVLRISFDPQTSGNFAGINIEEPQNWGTLQTGSGYDLRGALSLVFEVRSPNTASVQFGMGECTTQPFQVVSSDWQTLVIPLTSLVMPANAGITCPPALDSVHVLFTVVTNNANAPNGATVLLDNIQFIPVPARAAQSQAGQTLSLPLSTQSFGVVPQTTVPIPPDQANRNIAAIYEAALMIQVLYGQGDPVSALQVADAIHYALYHDNQGDYISTSPGATSGCFGGNAAAQCGLHNAYETGDIALFNDQNSGGAGKAGDVRLSGFTCGALSPTQYCMVLDGATGGNNAWAILALLEAYNQSGSTEYLTDAIAIGNWIIANLEDITGTGFGGYYVGYPDQGATPPKSLNKGKSTENNADIFAAFTALARFDTAHATMWTNAANVAGDFVMAMYDVTNGRFNAGTVTASPAATPGPGVCPTGATKGNDIINANSSPDCDFLDSNTFTTMAMAGSPRYFNYLLSNGTVMDWTRPVQYVLNTFPQTITVGGNTFHGFDIVPIPVSGANGIAWEFTGQAVETMWYVDQLYNRTTFEAQANFYLGEMQAAQASAPFGDGQGLVASTLQNGDVLPPLNQCLNTPYQNCPAERVGLAATTWLILAEKQINPLAGP